MKILAFVTLILVSTLSFAGSFQGIHLVKLKDGMQGYPVSASSALNTASTMVYIVPATGTFYLTGLYSNSQQTSLWDYSIGSGASIGYVFSLPAQLSTPIYIPPNTQLNCENTSFGPSVYCSITGIYNPK